MGFWGFGVISKQISAVDATIYMATQEDYSDWEESTKKFTSETVALLALIGVGLFMLGFFIGACVIIRCRQSNTRH